MPDTLAARVAELNDVVAKMTPGDVVYRPNEYDDWGVVRFIEPTLTLAAIGFKHGIPFAVASTAAYGEGQLNEHRRLGTDPAESDARGIAYLKNNATALVADLKAEIVALREENAEWVQAARDLCNADSEAKYKAALNTLRELKCGNAECRTPTLIVTSMEKVIGNLRAEVGRLRAALAGVVRVADRETDEFIAALAALAGKDGV